MARKTRAQSEAASSLQKIREREIREAEQIHNITVGAMLTPIMGSIAGVAFMLMGHVNNGAIVTTVSSISSTICFPLAKQSSQVTDKKRARVKKELSTEAKQENTP